ncbi:hypothetical protein MTO96_007668 [Rhipicephalus appendiculatus]
MVGKSSSLKRLQWEPPAKNSARFLTYTVNICTTFESCGGEDGMSNCTELQTNETWLNFQNSFSTKYCVMVATSSQCGSSVLSSRPAAAEIPTPLLDLPHVTNLNLVAADSHYITVAWDRPRLSFDFYWLDVTGGYENGNVSLPMRTASACGNGTIVRPQQTQITCGPFDSCSYVDVTVRTYTKGPPELLSTGTTLRDIFIHGQVATLPSTWQRPKGRFDHYSVEVNGDEGSSISAAQQWRHLCSNGTIIRPDQTEVTCGPFEPCTNVSCTVRTHVSGPPEHRSPGVTLTDIVIPAEDRIPAATNVTIAPESPSKTRLHWGRPEKQSGIIESYSVNICSTFGSCDPAEKLSDCIEQVTTNMWTVFDSKVDTSYCVLIAAKIRCGMDEIISRQVAAEVRTPLFDLPDVKDLRLLSAVDNAVTIAWKKPEARFDYYWVYIAVEEDDQQGYDGIGIVGSCGNGTIIHPDQTQLTCRHLKPCARVNITLRAQRNGPPERTSRGVCLQDIFIPGEEPDPPRNITIVGRSPSLTRLRWEPSARVSGKFLEYTVKTCTTFKSCSRDAHMSGCAEIQTYDSWLDFHSHVDTKYCVVVSASSQCGEDVLRGRPAVAEIRTPLFELPDVLNLTVDVANGYITFSWQRPQGRFDYYFIEIIQDGNKTSSQEKLRLCANGTIVHPSQSEVICGPYEPCTKVAYTMRTHLNGPQERSSPGVGVKEVFIPAEEPYPPSNIIIVPTSPSRSQLHWDHQGKANAVTDSYNVKICRTFRICGEAEYLGDCKEHVATETWVSFDSTADTAYCVLVTATTRCAADEISSRTAVAEIRTPIFELADVSNLMTTAGAMNGFITLTWQRPHAPPEVTNLHVVSVGADFFTAAWEKPKVSFDYYWIEVTGANNSRDWFNRGCGVTLTDFFIPGKVHVRNLTVSSIGDDNFTLTWQKEEGCLEYYTVTVTDNSDGSSGVGSNGIVDCLIAPVDGETLPGVYLPGKTVPAVTNLKLVKVTHSYFKVTYKTPKECYADFNHYVRPANKHARARLGDCHLDKAIDRMTATCLIGACGKVNIGVQTKGIQPSRRVSTWVRLAGVDTKRKCYGVK